MTVSDLLREVENRGVALAGVGNQLRFRPASALTPELVEGLREHKAAILERLENAQRCAFLSTPENGDQSPVSETTIRDTAEVLEMARARLGEMAPEYKMDAPYPPPEGNGDPLVHRHTPTAQFFQGVRRRDRERREREGLPPWIRLVDGGGDAA